MLKRWLWVMLLVGLALELTACAHFHRSESRLVYASNQTNTFSRKLQTTPSFSQVNIRGQLNVHLHTGAKRSTLIIQGDPRDVANLHWVVQREKLHMVLANGYPKYAPIEVDISTNLLSRLIYRGSGSIVGRELRSSQLDLDINNRKGTTDLEGQLHLHQVKLDGSGTVYIKGGASRDLDLTLKHKTRVQMVGTYGLHKLTMRDCSWLTLYWIKTDHLSLVLYRRARVQIAGTSRLLEATLYGNAQLNARYMRVKEAFVKTHGESVADIAVTRSQHTLATGDSHIYYHEKPKYQTDFMGDNGSVLNLKFWEPFLQ